MRNRNDLSSTFQTSTSLTSREKDKMSHKKAARKCGIKYGLQLLLVKFSIGTGILALIHYYLNPSILNTSSLSSYNISIPNIESSIEIIATLPEKVDQGARKDRDNLQDTIIMGKNITSPLQNCSPTFQVELFRKHSSFNSDRTNGWYLKTFDLYRNEKNIGGDEFYITYTDGERLEKYGHDNDNKGQDIEPDAVAFVQDLYDGTYQLDFFSTPMMARTESYDENFEKRKRGQIKINFEYTCGIGTIHQPKKKNWKSSGMMYRKPAYSNIVQQPPIRNFRHPSTVNLSNYSLVIFFGDSTMRQLVIKNETYDGHKEFFIPNIDYSTNVRSQLTTSLLRPNFLRKLHFLHGKQLNNLDNVALVLGSSIWDLLVERDDTQGSSFDDHLRACRYYIETLQQRYPKVDLYWKGTSALHPHRVNCSEANYDFRNCLNSTKYLSNSRVVYLEKKQKELMELLGIPYLDVYPAYYLSSYYTAPGDGRHAIPSLNEYILNWFFQTSN